MKHNKKRNTAFLYEILIKEYTKAVIKKNNECKQNIISILKEFFKRGTILHEELQLYNILLESDKVPSQYCSKLLSEVKIDFIKIDKRSVFNEQTRLIKKINETVSNEVFANFISNYKSIATVGQFFNSDKLNPKQRILIEEKLMKMLSSKKALNDDMPHVDNLTFKTFVNKFNESYRHSLREEQKELLTNYITSYIDNGLGLKIFMNEEIGRLKAEVVTMISEQKYSGRFLKIQKKLDNIKVQPISDSIVREVFLIQDLIYEVKKV